MTNSLADKYDHVYRNEVWQPVALRPHAISTHRRDDAARLLQAERGDLLELGCGSGALTIALAEQFQTAVGSDLSPVRVNRATEALQSRYPDLRDRVRFVVAAADQPLPFPDRSFDVVLASAVVEHVVDVFVTLDEIARVCKPGGCTLITVPNLAYIKYPLGLLFGRIPLTGSPTRDMKYWRENGWDGDHLHYFTRRAMHDLLEHAGFQPEAWTGDGKWAKWRRWATNLVGSLTVRARRRG